MVMLFIIVSVLLASVGNTNAKTQCTGHRGAKLFSAKRTKEGS